MIIIPKPGNDRNYPINHMPISLLNSKANVFNSFFFDQIKLSFALCPEQFSFRPYHSTTIQLVNVINHIVNNRNKKHITAAVALPNIEKAFDKV